MIDLLVRPAADAFLQVGVWVAVMLAVFGVVQWRTAGRVEGALRRHDRLAPIVGALLGVTPGCGGAIIVMPLYTRGTVSFGTMVATLVATLGDSAFVLLAAAPRTAVLVHGLALFAGVATGSTVDALGIRPERPLPERPTGILAPSTVGAAAAETDITGRRLAYRFPSPGILGFWGLVSGGLVLSVLVVFQLVPESAVTIGGVNTYLVVGAIGALVATGIFLASGNGMADDTIGSVLAKSRSLRGVLRHGARETAFVTVWVSVAFYVWAVVEAVGPVDPATLPIVGFLGVAIGALVGLIPGCGPQILFVGLFVQGGLPLSALVANAISQDGDALFPLLVTDRRSAAVATAVTTVPALLIGSLLVLGGA